jgi:hypothetical protein
MLERLRKQWHHDMSFDELVELRDDLERILQQIRSQRQIRPPIFKCPSCGHIGERAAPHVSVRAMILSLLRFGIAAAAETHLLEKAWAAHRKQKGLDLYGRSSEPKSALCVHPPVR